MNKNSKSTWHKFCKLFTLPGPAEMGKAEYDALPMRDFGSKSGDYCWEDFHEDQKKAYPVRVFLLKTVPEWLKFKIWFRISHPVEKVYDYLRYHLHPKHRYHMLDLRNPEYKYGWCDRSETLVYANFKTMEQFVEKELDGRDNILWITEEMIQKEDHECAKLQLQRQRSDQEKLLKVYDYWKTDRPARIKAYDDALMDPNKKDYKLTWQIEKENTEKETEMLHLLIEIRGSLWT